MAIIDSKTSYEAFPMLGGDDHQSYSQNSEFQKGAIDSAKELIHGSIGEFLDLQNPSFDGNKTVKIADFGCSIGPNTFISMDNIICALELKSLANRKPLEFQVFFNDHTGNDFNTLFKNLTSSTRTYFSCGVPGSFYDRLFPKSSLDIAYTSFALHWLSKIPEELVNRSSSAWNKTSICCSGNVKEVAQSYLGQFSKDMESFLSARAEELVGGGLTMIIVPGIPDGIRFSETSVSMVFDLIRSCLMDMTNMGKISEEKVEDFNLPIYYPTMTELKAIIERNGNFSIKKAHTLRHPMKEIKPSAEFLTSWFRAILQEVIREWFGDGILDELFERFAEKLSENIFLAEPEHRKQVEYFMLLKRNSS